MRVWCVWILVALVLFIAEVFTPGFLFACFAVACLVSGFAAFLGIGAKGQILAFSIATLAGFVALRPILMAKYSSRRRIKTNVDALVGKKCRVSETIDPASGKGRALVEGDDWKATSVDDTIIQAGQKAIVVKVQGTTLYLRFQPEGGK